MKSPCLTAITVAAALTVGIPAHATPAPPERFVLIVTNNRSIELGRPDLSYADDDGAKYYDVFRTVAPEAHVHLLTELDRDTARLFPALSAVIQPPSKRAVWSAVATIAGEVAAARRAGHDAELTFIYAGHGDIDNGRGFLELSDGRLTSDDLEALLTRVSATRSHVILDSCNAFFVINARKPGGRHFATPADAAESLSKRFPDVGVFLSTSAEAEVFEWSELQSGIFSHAVRSGLMGAADADGNGAVTYEELAAFVDTATAGVKNPRYRPKVFARGPNGRRETALFSPGPTAKTVTLDTARQTRLTVRDADDLPWIDLFKEAGAPMVLHLPERLDSATVEELEVSPSGTHVVAGHRLETSPDADGRSLRAIAVADSTRAARGPSDLFRMLFTRPFGPRAVAAYRTAQASEPPPVFGISREDAGRMSSLLAQVGEIDHARRISRGTAFAGLGALAFGIGAVALDQHNDDSRGGAAAHVGGWLALGAGVFAAYEAYVTLARPSAAERLHDRVARGLAAGGNPDAIVADTERRLQDLAAQHRRERMRQRYAGVAGVVLMSGLFVFNEINRNDPEIKPQLNFLRLWSGTMMTFSTGIIVSSFFELPMERMVHLWNADPGIHRVPRLSIAPNPGGLTISATTQF